MLTCLTLMFCAACAFLEEDVPAIQIGGKPVAAATWKFLKLTRGVGEQATPEQRAALEEQLIDRVLIQRFLEQQQVAAPEELLALRLFELESLIRRKGLEPAALYAQVGLTPEVVRQELALGAAWETWIERSVTAEQLRTAFQNQRAEVDGTRVRVRQIFLRATTPEEVAQATARLEALRRQIVARQVPFEAAAKEHSQSPSRAQGGDVGWIVGLGQMPEDVSRMALSLKPGEVGTPVRSPLGVHLVTVTEREPGQLSLEDVRPQLLDRFSQQRWREVADAARKSTPILRPASRP